MDEIAKIMARGLIALPSTSSVRKKAGLQEGDLVRVEVRDGEIVIRKEKRIYDLKGALSKEVPKKVDFGEILAEEMKKRMGG